MKERAKIANIGGRPRYTYCEQGDDSITSSLLCFHCSSWIGLEFLPINRSLRARHNCGADERRKRREHMMLSEEI